jgi:transcriptional enhancer factor
MPHMGRRKFSMVGKLHGRNMLISEYIFVICVALLGSKEIFRIDNSNDSIEQMGRKQVSSHMQVVKKFFEDLRCFHFLFPAEEKKEPGTTNSDDFYEEEEQESFKSNPVLTALAEGRVPDVKPNYEYFSQLLALQSCITIRPKTCEIFVSSPDVKIRDDMAYDIHDQPLDQASFPHLNKYINCDDTPNVLGKDVLLHEYTRAIDRTTSVCVKTITRRWQRDAPAMYDSLELPSMDEECLLLEMCATVELHEHAKFPTGSELTGFVEVAVTQPVLQNHRWKCITKLTRPPELHADDGKPEVYTNESGIHRRGCGDSRTECDCHMSPRPDIHVPFPAVEWASILSMAVQYPDHEHQRKKEKRSRGDKKQDLDRSGSKRKRSEDEGDAAAWSRREPTGSDLICKVAMYQELWSCPPDSNRWSRQAIIFWRFDTTNQWYKYNPVFRPAGTTWRWLTINDPMSRYHQQKALVLPSPAVSRDAVMSPTPSVSQHLAATMSEQFSQAWDNNVNLTQMPSGTNTSGMNFLDSFPSGLVTPPPSASLHGSYSTSGSFDGNNGVGSFLPSSCGSESQAATMTPTQPYFDGGQAVGTFGDVKPMGGGPVNSYMSSATGPLDLSGQLVYDGTSTGSGAPHGHQNNGPSDSLQGWDMAALDGWGPQPATSSGTPATSSDWMSAAPGPQKLDQSHMWNNVHWAPGAPNGSAGPTREGSPRSLKRRRTGTLEDLVPMPAGWQG